MKLRNLLFSLSVIAAGNAFAQSVPTHPMYVDFGITDRESIVAALDAWEPGGNFSKDSEYKDENFFISRVPLKERFINKDLQANKAIALDKNKNLCWCSPIGDMTKKWGPLPRYNFDADNFNMWQYLNIHANWSNSWWRAPGAFNDVAHKNGVRTGCLYFIDWAAQVNSTSPAGKPLADLCVKENGKFKYAEKLIDFLRYYGIDGLGLNPEGYWNSTLNNDFQDFLAECHRIAQEKNFPFHVEWYAFVSNSGGLTDNGCRLDNANDKWFHKNGYPVTDVFFLNYNWVDDDLRESAQTAENLGRSTFDVYAGFDQQGRGYGGQGNGGWQVLMNNPVSIVVWGAHDRSQLYASSAEDGTSALSVMNEYQKKQELLFTGGTRNVLKRLPLNTGDVDAVYSDLASWHGYSHAVIEQSSLTEVPFVTRFGLGNGNKFRKEGKVTFDHQWYNIGVQDYLPTWRWWIDNGDGKTAPEQSIQCDFNYNDSWFAGSSVEFHGQTPRSDVRLFSTKFDVASGDDYFTITYKPNSKDANMELMVSKSVSANTFSFYELPEANPGNWNTVTIKASELDLNAGDEIACIGLSFKNTPENYSTLVGELGFIPADFNTVPVKPVIKYSEVLQRNYNRADFKVVFDMPFDGQRKPEYEGCPIYNEEVGAWYYEIYVKQGETETLVTTTTSWAAYAVEAPLYDSSNPKFQIGVRAVGLDGKTASETTWTEELESELTVIETLTIDKDIIKPNEEFTIGFEDPNHAPSTIKLYNSLTGAEVAAKEGVLNLTTSLSEVGSYDVEVTVDGSTTMTRGLVMVTPEATGRLPQLGNLTNPTNVEANSDVDFKVEVSKGDTYNGQPCRVSKSLYMKEPYQLTVDSKILSTYTQNSFALWFKVEKFEHASLGTLLMTKVNRNYEKQVPGGTWTENVWGEMWTAIRPENYSKYKNAPNELSVSVDAPAAGTPDYEHNNEVDGISTGYSLSPNVWYHVCVVKDNKNVKLYLNGKKIIDVQSRGAGPKDWKGANFYVGGSMTNLASFTGWVDEVQVWSKALTDAEVVTAMKGFRGNMDGLEGYFTFETQETDEEGYIYFPNQGTNKTVTGAYMTTGQTTESGNVDNKQNQLTTALGVPSIMGNQAVTFESVQWLVDGGQLISSDEEGNAKVTYAEKGTYSVEITANNSWGSTKKAFKDCIIVSSEGSGLNESKAENMMIYPNPFNDVANILFAKSGDYEVEVFDASGKIVYSNNYSALSSEVCSLTVNGPAGLYYVVVKQDGKCLQSFKIMKNQ